VKYLNSLFTLILISFLFCNTYIFARQNSGKSEIIKSNNIVVDSLDFIKICKWKDDAKTCVNFSFDDGLPSFRRISQIFDLYDFKASFFVIASTMQIDSVKDICARGHEIASHSFSHPLFEVLDSSKIDYQIRKGQEMIENALGIKCICFGEPGNFKSYLCSEIAFRYHLFVRHYSEYPEIKRLELDLRQSNNEKFIPILNTAISNGSLLEIVSHGINGDGYLPLSEDLIFQELNIIKGYTQTGDVWLTTVKEGISYENLYHEISLDKSIEGDTLKLNFRNYNKEKYKDMDASILSIEIPYTICKEINCLTDFVQVKELPEKFVLTTDLKKNTSLEVLLKGN